MGLEPRETLEGWWALGCPSSMPNKPWLFREPRSMLWRYVLVHCVYVHCVMLT